MHCRWQANSPRSGAFAPEARRLPDYTRGLALHRIKRGYDMLCCHAGTLLLAPVAATVLAELWRMLLRGELQQLWDMARETELQVNMATVLASCMLLTAALAAWVCKRARPIFLVDYHVFKAPDCLKTEFSTWMNGARQQPGWDGETLAFMEKVLLNSGVGPQTYMPAALHKTPPWDTCMAERRREAQMVMYGSVDSLLKATGTRAQQVDILVVCCSIFNPTPSLSAMLVNHFKMRSSVITYNLSGMGCSAGLIAISLVRELLQVYPNAMALVVSTENITQNVYLGRQRSMCIPGCIFRVGGAAVLLSNRRSDAWRAKYELVHLVRTHLGADNTAYRCVFLQEDDEGFVGVKLAKDLMAVAGKALKANIITLGPLVLPLSEQLRFAANAVARRCPGMKLAPYVPDFSRAFEHFCLHTGGRGVLDAMEQQLRLPARLMQPSRAALWRYGNVSSSSIWYVLANIETMQGVHRGDRVWQLAFGSGFKCNSAVWRARRAVRTQHEAFLNDE
ncbi:hypothetical protein WJX81_004266 [Elliptochloris bilobata]|uniref:3-ketoacyl-CoA synthase n=1 Tax=Elliptochloris bilobata TaxID=381761 RepID=A0AAW1S7P1_9CHLO